LTWNIAKQGGPDVTIVPQGNRTAYIVDMKQKVGYVGGQAGAAAGNPAATHVQIIVESGNNLITAYPVIP